MVRRGTGPRPVRVGDVFETIGETQFGPSGQRGVVTGRPFDDFGNPLEGKWEVRMYDRATGSLPEENIQRV